MVSVVTADTFNILKDGGNSQSSSASNFRGNRTTYSRSTSQPHGWTNDYSYQSQDSNKPEVYYFKGKDEVLSNFYQTRIHIFKRKFSATECAYQYCKAVFHKSLDIAEELVAVHSGLKAKAISHKVRTDPEWHELKVEAMRVIIGAKIEQCLPFQKFLLSHPDTKLVENTDNEYWARGANGNGENMLGTILMEIRDEWINKADAKEIREKRLQEFMEKMEWPEPRRERKDYQERRERGWGGSERRDWRGRDSGNDGRKEEGRRSRNYEDRKKDNWNIPMTKTKDDSRNNHTDSRNGCYKDDSQKHPMRENGNDFGNANSENWEDDYQKSDTNGNQESKFEGSSWKESWTTTQDKRRPKRQEDPFEETPENWDETEDNADTKEKQPREIGNYTEGPENAHMQESQEHGNGIGKGMPETAHMQKNQEQEYGNYPEIPQKAHMQKNQEQEYGNYPEMPQSAHMQKNQEQEYGNYPEKPQNAHMQKNQEQEYGNDKGVPENVHMQKHPQAKKELWADVPEDEPDGAADWADRQDTDTLEPIKEETASRQSHGKTPSQMAKSSRKQQIKKNQRKKKKLAQKAAQEGN